MGMFDIMENQYILITGGAGFIGSHAVRVFIQQGYNVVIFDNLSRGFREAVTTLQAIGAVEFIQGDIRRKNDIEKAFAKYNIIGVIHFAAVCSVEESMKFPEFYFENNIIGAYNLFETMRENGVKNIIFSSSCAVYANSEYLPIDEKHPTIPLNPYGESKLQTERLLYWYQSIHDFNYIILRYFNVCGCAFDGIIGDSKKPSLLLIQNAVRGAMCIEPFQFTYAPVDTPDGSPIRDYIDVEDLVDAHYNAYQCLLENDESYIINLGSGCGYSVKEIVAQVENEFSTTIKKIPEAKRRQSENAVLYADINQAKNILKWNPKKSILDSIVSLKHWYSTHPNGWND